MDDPLFEYFERELTFLRGMGAEYARKYPTVAGRLQLEADHSPDPHTERLIEAFAFLAGRIHKKLDDDFPEITESLFQIVYPHYVRPIPSMSIVEFVPLFKNLTPSGYTIPAGTPLFRKHGEERCQFETRQPVDLWPVSVSEAEYRDPPRPVAGAMGA
ncbi:MAG: type VI secretion system baseplate subunit TssF, partial [Desulfococcaceae bacterium]